MIDVSVYVGSVAKKAAESGLADGILVSAHGGRQLDGVPAPVRRSFKVLYLY